MSPLFLRREESMESFSVVIIEDDFRIANIHEKMIVENNALQVIQKCLTAKEAFNFLKETESLPSVILLDMYIPDVEGFDLIEQLRKTYPYIAIIIASAATDIETIQRAKLIGVFDYIVKPIEKNRLQQSFQKFINLMTVKSETVTQHELDMFYGQSAIPTQEINVNETEANLPKGIDSITLEKIKTTLLNNNKMEMTAHRLGEVIGISRSTARRYLEYLVSLEIVSATLYYGQVGRPQRIYKIHEQYEHN